MKRIVGTVVALAAVLSFSTVANAALINYNVSGTGTVTTINALGVFVTPFSAGSSVSVETDTNGDLVEGDVSLVGGTLNLVQFVDLSAAGLGSLDLNISTAMSGGTGYLSGEDILWGTAANTTLLTTGTVTCQGAICSLLVDPGGNPWVAGFAYPYALYAANNVGLGNTYVNPTSLGTWDISGGVIVGSSINVVTVQTSNPINPTSFNLFGGNNLGAPTPEPSAMALVLLGLGGLALRSRKA